MPEAARMEPVEAVFSGMAKRRVAEIMAKGNGLSQVFVQAQTDSYGPSNLGYFQHMRQTGAVVVACGGQKNLGLVFKTTKGFAMNDSVAVTLKSGAQLTGRLIMQPAPRPAAQAGMRRENEQFLFFQLRTDLHNTF
jgi:hypothetical protein